MEHNTNKATYKKPYTVMMCINNETCLLGTSFNNSQHNPGRRKPGPQAFKAKQGFDWYDDDDEVASDKGTTSLWSD